MEPTKNQSGFSSDAKKEPRRIVFITRNVSAKVKDERGPKLMTYPHLLVREAIVFEVLIIAMVVIALFWDAPLEQLANPLLTPNPAKAPWYFLGLQEMVSYSAFWGGVGIPTLEVIILLLVPYIDRKPVGVGRWFAKERLLANSLFMTFVVVNVVLMVIGTFFRGPNWEFVSPW